MRSTITDADTLVSSMGRTSISVNEMLKTADSLIARFDKPDTISTTQSTQVTQAESHHFDIRDYTEAIQELAVTVEKVNDVIKSSDELLKSSGWDRRIDQVNLSADDRMKMASTQSQLLVKEVFRGIYFAIGFLFAMLILYRVITFLFARRLRAIEARPHDTHEHEGPE